MAVQMTKQLLSEQAKVAADPVFSVEANWHMVTWVFKKAGGSRRIVATFRDFSTAKAVALKSGMASGEVYQLHKIIVAKSDRTLLVLKRSEIADAASYDVTLA